MALTFAAVLPCEAVPPSGVEEPHAALLAARHEVRARAAQPARVGPAPRRHGRVFELRPGLELPICQPATPTPRSHGH
jgi:hypothetical protein